MWFSVAQGRDEVRLTSGDDVYRADRHGSPVYVVGLPGSDGIAGTQADDVLSGGAGSDDLVGRNGNDLLFGGGGRDSLSGGTGRDRLFGGSGRDSLAGGDGADVIVGGGGSDSIDVGGGYQLAPDQSRDRVIYTAASASSADAPDEISFFDPDRDIVDLRRIDADTTVAGNQAFHFIGDAAFSGTAGELAYHPADQRGGTGVLAADVDGDGQADLVVDFINYGPVFTLTEDNFKL